MLLQIKKVAANKKKMFPVQIKKCCERFEPRNHFKSRMSLIIQVDVVLKRTVVVDSD